MIKPRTRRKRVKRSRIKRKLLRDTLAALLLLC
jgi:hypothetical protein